jgi:hypothetical protein
MTSWEKARILIPNSAKPYYSSYPITLTDSVHKRASFPYLISKENT